MKRAAIILTLLVAPGCQRDNCGETPWSRFIATLSGMSPPAQLDCWQTPTSTPQASAGEGDAGTCAPDPGDDPCVLCAKASCCTEVLDCLDDPACDGPADQAYATAARCVSNHCAERCGGT